MIDSLLFVEDESGMPKTEPNVVPNEETVLSLTDGTLALSKPAGSCEGEKNSLTEERDETIEVETEDWAESRTKGSGCAETGAGG